jgi:hypothetical protein
MICKHSNANKVYSDNVQDKIFFDYSLFRSIEVADDCFVKVGGGTRQAYYIWLNTQRRSV